MNAHKFDFDFSDLWTDDQRRLSLLVKAMETKRREEARTRASSLYCPPPPSPEDFAYLLAPQGEGEE